MESDNRVPGLTKTIHEKENQQKHVNKKTDILTSLNNIKLPLQGSIRNYGCKEAQFQSVPLNSLGTGTLVKELCESARYGNPTKNKRRNSFMPKSNQLGNSEEYCLTYKSELMKHLIDNTAPKTHFLHNHKIDGLLRARMLDWMVQVMGSYNFQPKTYFTGVDVMDRYFASATEELQPSQLHIIGVQSMFIATKMQQVYPLKIKTVYQKIAHKKIPVADLVSVEKKIYQALDYKATSSTFFDVACSLIVMSLAKSEKYSEALVKEMEAVCACLSKFICYNYEMMCHFQNSVIGGCLAEYVLGIYNIEFDLILVQCCPGSYREKCRQAILDSITSFRKKFKGLNNLAKFTDKVVLDIIEMGLF